MNDAITLAKIEIRDTVISFEVSTALAEAISEASQKKELKLSDYHAEAVVESLKKILPVSLKLPSCKQESYAKVIAKTLNLDLSRDVFRTAKNCSLFLDMYAEPYQDFKEQSQDFIVGNIPLISQAYRVHKWLEIKTKLDSGETIESVAEELEKTPATIEEHCMCLGDWNEKASDDGSFDVVMKLVSMLKKGENISVFYYSNLF